MSNYDSNKYEKKYEKDVHIDNEVKKLFKKNNGIITTADFMKLRHKYDDAELVENIQRLYLEKYNLISKKAKKFAKLVREKYGDQQYPFHQLLSKTKLFAAKYKMSPEEYAEFQRIYEQELVGLKSPDVLAVTTNMMKLLGSVNIDFQGFATKLNDTDYKYLQEILKLYSVSRPLHAQVLLQSVQYRDCDFEALTGEFRKELGHRPGDSIHPVIAALFLPKIDILETHFLHSNIAGIVKARYNNEPLYTRPDFVLFDALIKDPNDVVCDNRSSVLDLLNRSQIQYQLWNSVLNLRNGQYYNSVFREFITSIDVCKLNKQDNPDLIYGRYDGTVLKRLLATFSFRPTIVSTMPVYNIVNMNPYQQNIRPIVTSVPMINLKLPASLDDETPISLQDALEQHQFFIENNTLVPRHTSLIYSRGVLFFFVDRRANIIRYNDIQPFNVARLPIAVSGFERLNDREIDFDHIIKLRGDVYQLRSIVIAEINRNTPEKNIVVGSSTLVMIHPDISNNIFKEEYFIYDPVNVIDSIKSETGTLVNRPPISQIYGGPGLGPEGRSFIELARKRGIIFMYELKSGQAVKNNEDITF
jgi:hypothetical protein